MLRSLPLSRTSALSLTVILSTLALFATGATFAVWTGNGVATGTVTAADLEIEVGSATTPGTVSFLSGTGCPGPILPGTTCTANVTVKNTGTLYLVIGTPILSVAIANIEGACTTLPADLADWDYGAGIYTYEGLDTVLSPTLVAQNDDSAFFEVSVTLRSDAATGCQGSQITVTVTVNASETPPA
jgi:hypothetical protein